MRRGSHDYFHVLSDSYMFWRDCKCTLFINPLKILQIYYYLYFPLKVTVIYKSVDDFVNILSFSLSDDFLNL